MIYGMYFGFDLCASWLNLTIGVNSNMVIT
jgi:hypothetical protein